MRRMLSRPRQANQVGRDVALFVPSVWTTAPLGLIALSMLLRTGFYSVLFWAAMMAATAAAVWAELKLVPRLILWRYGFRLMRFEYHDDTTNQNVFTTAPRGKTVGFCCLRYSDEIGSFHEGEVVAAVVKGDNIVALIRLRLDQPLEVLSIIRSVNQEAVLRPLKPDTVELAKEFAHACDQFLSTQVQVEKTRTIRVSKNQRPAAPAGNAWANLILEPSIKEQLVRSANHFSAGHSSASKGLLLYGPPGTGKTEIAKALAASMGCAFFSKSLSHLKGEYIGHSSAAVKKVWAEALAEERAVLFIDECDAVFGRRDGETDNFVKDIVNSFIAEWDGFDKQRTVWVVGATNRRDRIDPAVLSRFAEQIEIGLPSPDQRSAILSNELAKVGARWSLPSETARLTQGMAGRDLEALAGALVRQGCPDGTVTNGMLEKLTGSHRRQLSAQTDNNASWNQLVLQDDVMQSLKRTAKLLQHAEHFRSQNLSVPQAMLLYGPPGTGKTQIARTLANETGLSFLAASTSDLKGSHIGDSGKNVQQLFQRAREATPALLFIDEIDLLTAARGSGDIYTGEIVGQLLQEMDGIQAYAGHVFVLAASNRREAIDTAVLSRFTVQSEIPLPDGIGLRQMLRVMLEGKPLAFDLDVSLEDLCVSKIGWSGRDLKNWVRRAEQRAMERALDSNEPTEVALSLGDLGETEHCP